VLSFLKKAVFRWDGKKPLDVVVVHFAVFCKKGYKSKDQGVIHGLMLTHGPSTVLCNVTEFL
jgi:hypothetical protein